MDKTPDTSTAPRDERETWEKNRTEIDKQWEAALQSEISAMVPAKLPISTPPIRYAA
jgi:hypothetical protein